MADRRRDRFALALGSAVLLALAFPPVPTGLTAFVGLLPFLFLLHRLEGQAAVFRWSYLTFFLLDAGTIYWISGWSGSDPWLKVSGVAVILVHPLLFTLPAMTHHALRRRLGDDTAVLLFPFVWTAWEWLVHLPEISFPWLLLANTQTYDIERIQFIAWTGAFGASFWIAAVNAGAYAWLRGLLTGGMPLRSRRSALGIAVLLVALLLPEMHGRIVMLDAGRDRTIRVGIIQPDVDPYLKWSGSETPRAMLHRLFAPFDSLVASAHPDLVLLPETAIPFRILTPEYAGEMKELRGRVDSARTAVLTGFPDLRWYFPGDPAPPSARKLPDADIRYESFNAALLLPPRNAPAQVYRKMKLTPMSERIPYLDALPFLQDAMSWGVGISNWGIGRDTVVFRLPTARDTVGVWPMICYETIYPSFVALYPARGAGVLCVITNDGWFGRTSGPEQLKQYTVLRAIENRRAVARCANNGISCFIDPYGRVSGETPLYQRAAIAEDVAVRHDRTFYTEHGDWLPQLCVAVTALALAAGFITRRRRRP